MTSNPPPPSDAEPTTEAIVVAIHCRFAERESPVRVVRVERHRSAYSTSFVLENIDATLSDGRTLLLILKHLQWSCLLPEARDVRPQFLHDPNREINFYERALVGRFGTPEVYASNASEAGGPVWLLLERITGEKLCHTGEIEVWEEAARWIGEFQQQLEFERSVIEAGVPLLRHDRAYYARWLDRARSVLAALELREAPCVLDTFERVIPCLCEGWQSLLHGEFYASNILVRAGARAGQRICPVDWEMASIGPPLADLAALTAGGWGDVDRQRIESAYFDARPPALLRMNRDDFRGMLDACRLAQAIQWIGWSGAWTPPADQANDWHAEAIAVAKRLGK